MKAFYFSLLVIVLFTACNSENPVDPPHEKEPVWVPRNNGLNSLTIQAIGGAVNSLYIGTFDGVSKSEDGGESWMPVNGGLESRDVTSLAVDPGNPDHVYCGTWGKGVFKSSDGGSTWKSVWSASQDPRIHELCLVAADQLLWAGTENGLYRSADSGASWQRYLYGRVLSIAVRPDQPQSIYAGIMYHGNFKSSDGGESWTEINDGLLTTEDGTASANSFTFSPANPFEIVISTGWVDLYKSVDGGGSWQQFADRLSYLDVVSVAFDPGDENKLWAATKSHGVFRSVDGGESWEEVKGLGSLEMKRIILFSGPETVLYAGTTEKGIFKYSDE